MQPVTKKVLTTSRLKKMSMTKLVELADSMATRLQWLHSVGKSEENPVQFKRLASELYHVSEVIDWKESMRKTKKFKY